MMDRFLYIVSFFPPYSYLVWPDNLRVSTVLEDKSLKERYYMGSWHMFLPSEVSLGSFFGTLCRYTCEMQNVQHVLRIRTIFGEY